MPLPNLLFPTKVQIAQIDTGNTIYDDRAREPIGNAETETVITLKAQPCWKRQDKPKAEFAGTREQSLGYLLFRYKDLEAAGVTLNRGDRIIKIGHRSFNLFIYYFRDCGHWGDQDGASLVKAYFIDRHPSRQEGDL